MLNTLDRLLRWGCGVLCAVALFVIMWLTFFDVGGRKFLDHSIPGSLEITEVLMVIVIFGALPLVSWRGEHVVFDSFDRIVPQRLKGLQARFVNLVCAGLFGMLAWLLTLRARRFAEYGDVTVYLQLSLAPVAWLMAALLLGTALVHLIFAVWPAAAGRANAHQPTSTV
jgi:TRAP-type transport system small permease protein